MSDERYHKPDCESLTCLRCLPPVAVLNDPAYIALQAALAEKEGKLKIMTDDAGRWESAFQAETLARSNDNAAQAQEIKTLREERDMFQRQAIDHGVRREKSEEDVENWKNHSEALDKSMDAYLQMPEQIAAKDRIISEQAVVIERAREYWNESKPKEHWQYTNAGGLLDAALAALPAPQPAQEKL